MNNNTRLNNVSNNFNGGRCIDCMELTKNCACNEIAFTKLDTLNLDGSKYTVVSTATHHSMDCDTCISFSCTECPRYTAY